MQSGISNIPPLPGVRAIIGLGGAVLGLLLCMVCALAAVPTLQAAQGARTPQAAGTLPTTLPVTGTIPVGLPVIPQQPGGQPVPAQPTAAMPAITALSPTVCPITISGTAFNDLNHNQRRDANEPVMTGVTVNLNGANGQASVAVTDGTGRYQFLSLPAGSFVLQVLAPFGWNATTPTAATINLANCGSSFTFDFGFAPIPPQPTAVVNTPAPNNPAPTVIVPPSATASPTVSPSPTPGALAGKVTNSRYGYGVSNAILTANGPGGAAAQTNNAGQYSFPLLNPGAYLLSLTRTGYKSLNMSQVVNPGANSMDIAMEPCVKLTDHSLRSTDARPGFALAMIYTMNNTCVSPVQVWLGTRLRLASTILVDPSHDISVAVRAIGTVKSFRMFPLPKTAAAGQYDVEWTIWEGKSGSSLQNKYDSSDFSANPGVLTVVVPN